MAPYVGAPEIKARRLVLAVEYHGQIGNPGVKELRRPNRIVIEWENGGEYTQVTWSIEETEQGDTILTIEESGFTGSSDAITERALDSTGGFNQVIIAAKALIEYNVGVNVVADHA